ncbi:MAG TPA: hypothetical protein VMG12_09625, partial [Polyangiaceae bacterium]|nr:hypothetical protein [Polyangiaceae bacterium]
MKSGFSVRFGVFAVVALVLFALLAQHTIARGERELQESDDAFASGQLDLAVLHARRAAAAYVPGARHVAAGFARLRAVARGAEREGELERARSAWGAMRAASIESRHMWQPQPELLDEADAELARLSNGALSARREPSAGLPSSLLGGLVLGAAMALLGWAAWRSDDGSESHPR